MGFAFRNGSCDLVFARAATGRGSGGWNIKGTLERVGEPFVLQLDSPWIGEEQDGGKKRRLGLGNGFRTRESSDLVPCTAEAERSGRR